jgi:PAS domain S-box-containing protein
MGTETKSSQELQALLDAAVDGVVVIDHRGSIQSFNRSAERLFGYGAQEIIGRNVSVLMGEEDRIAHDGYLQRYASTRVPHIIGRGREVNAMRKDGSLFPDSSVSSTTLRPAGAPMRSRFGCRIV